MEPLLDVALSQVMIWSRAVSLQIDRLTPSRENPVRLYDVIADSFLLAIALRDLLRAAEVVLKFGDAEAVRLVEEFTGAVPGIVEARNVLEHFDEYVKGTGRNKKVDAYEAKVRSDETGRLVLIVGPYEIDLSGGAQAAERLGGSLPMWGARRAAGL